MPRHDLVTMFLENVSGEYPKHILCSFAGQLARGNHVSFTTDLLDALEAVDSISPGYASAMFQRIGAIRGVGEEQYEAVLQILSEIYVTSGLAGKADNDGGEITFRHEPSVGAQKNPEFEVRVNGKWLAVEVKTPRLIRHGRYRTSREWQLNARLGGTKMSTTDKTLPRDNPVKDFLVSAEEKFVSYVQFRADAYRVLVIVWDDFSNEPIAALQSRGSGLLTDNSFCKDDNGESVTFPHIDGVVVIRHYHQLIRATCREPLVDDVPSAFAFQLNAFPPKAYIRCPGGKPLPEDFLRALDATPIENCMGAEYHPSEMVIWFGDDSR